MNIIIKIEYLETHLILNYIIMKEYNQLEQKATWYACSIYALLNLLKYDYWVYIETTKTLKFLVYLEVIGVFFRLEGSCAKYIFPSAIKHINKLLWLELKLWTTTLKSKLSTKYGYILWYKRANTYYKNSASDWEITKEEIEKIEDTKANWHFHFWKRWKIVESLWGFRYKLSIDNLKYAYSKDMYYTNCRYIYWEEELKKEFIHIVKLRKLQKLDNPFIKYNEIIKIKKELNKD